MHELLFFCFSPYHTMARGRYSIISYTEVIEMNPSQLTTAVTALANLLASELTTDELSLLASLLVQLSDTLGTIAAQRSLYENKANERRQAPDR